MTFGERPAPQLVEAREFATTGDARLLVAPTSRGDEQVRLVVDSGSGPNGAAVEAVALAALIADLNGRLDVLRASAPEVAR